MTRAGLPHSDTLGSQLGRQLPQAYRRLPRPSSAPGTKASTVRPYQLTHTHNTYLQTNHTRQHARVHYANLTPPPTHHRPPPPRTAHDHAWHQDNNPTHQA